MDDRLLGQFVTQAPAGGAGVGNGAYYYPASMHQHHSHSHINPLSMRSSPHLGTEKHFTDLLIFERRIRQNLFKANTSWLRYQLLFAFLLLTILYCGWQLGDSTTMGTTVYVIHVTAFAGAFISLGVLIGSGLYAERTAQARAFLPRCQRSLANFCLGFSPENGGQLTFIARRKLPAKFVNEFMQFRESILTVRPSPALNPTNGAGSSTSATNNASNGSNGVASADERPDRPAYHTRSHSE